MPRFIVPFITKLFLLGVMVIALFQTSFAADETHPFFIAGDEDEPPFGFIKSNNEFSGIFVDIMKEACARLNIPLKHLPYPWVRAQYLVKSGEADAIITVPTDERMKFLSPTRESVIDFQWVAFVRKDNPKYKQMRSFTKISDFKGYKVLDYIGDGWGEQNLKGLDVDRNGNYQQALLRLAGKRGDVFIFTKVATKYLLTEMIRNPEYKNMGLEMVTDLPNILYAQGFHLLISKTSPYASMIPQFDNVLAEMKADGTIQAIISKYL